MNLLVSLFEGNLLEVGLSQDNLDILPIYPIQR